MDASVKIADLPDVAALLEIGEKANQSVGAPPLNKEKAAESLRQIITAPSGIILTAKGSFIAGVVLEDPFRDTSMLVKQLWCGVRSGTAVKVLSEFVNYGKILEVDYISVSLLSSSPAGASEILKRKGFVEFETSYILER